MSDDTNRRPETGPMRFGDDWTGVFIRGDHAMYQAMQLKWLLETLSDECKKRAGALLLMEIEGLISTLSSSTHVTAENPDAQVLKSFDSCVCLKHQEHLDEADAVLKMSDDDLEELYRIRMSLHSAALQNKLHAEMLRRGLVHVT